MSYAGIGKEALIDKLKSSYIISVNHVLKATSSTYAERMHDQK
jgi:hypothetical protein